MAALAACVLVMHAYAMWAFGATFWYDSVNYLQLGMALIDGNIRDFFSGPRYYIFQHLMPALPLLLGALHTLDGRYGWLVLAGLQHFIAACSLVYLLGSLNHRWPQAWRWVGAVVICAHPYYMAFHNAPMTESLASSALLVVIAASMRALRNARAWTEWVVLAVTGILGVQLRSYTAFYVLACLAILLVRGVDPKRRWPIIGVGVLVAGSLLAFPAYRWARIGAFFLPNVDYVSLPHALYINPRLSASAVRMLDDMPLPRGESPARIATHGLTYLEAANIGAHLTSVGYRDGEARQLVRRVVWDIRTDSVPVVVNQFRLALLSVGCPHVALLGPRGSPFFRGYTLGEFRDHVDYYYQWFAWLKFDDYLPVFDQFLTRFAQDAVTIDTAAGRSLEGFLRPFIVGRASSVRDPLRLASIPLELWFLGWLLGTAVIGRKNWAHAALLLVAPAVTYAGSIHVPLGDVRYAQPLLPLYILTTAALLPALGARVTRIRAATRWPWARRRHRNAGEVTSQLAVPAAGITPLSQQDAAAKPRKDGPADAMPPHCE